MTTFTSKNGTKYNVIETYLKEEDFYNFKSTDKGIFVCLGANVENLGDTIISFWLPKWAIQNNGDIWLTQKMRKFNVFVADLNEWQEWEQSRLINSIEKY